MENDLPQPEFSRIYDRREIPAAAIEIAANAEERGALAKRFGLVSVAKLEAVITLSEDGDAVNAQGQMRAEFVQSCAISGDDLSMRVAEEIGFRFAPDRPFSPDEEVELEEAELDEIPLDGTSFDLGEAVAQSLALAIDPYAIGPDADAVRKQHDLADEAPSGPLAEALKALKKD